MIDGGVIEHQRRVPIQVGHNNSVVSSTTPQSIRPGPPSTSSTSLPIIEAPNLNESSRQEACTSFPYVEERGSGYGCVNNKSTTSSDQKSLKVRIKMGSDNLSTRKNDAIYSGLGLDVSPSSSLDDSPSESEGISRELQDGPFESPTSILQVYLCKNMLVVSPPHFPVFPFFTAIMCLSDQNAINSWSR